VRLVSRIRIFSNLAILESEHSETQCDLRSNPNISIRLRGHTTFKCTAEVQGLLAHNSRFQTIFTPPSTVSTHATFRRAGMDERRDVSKKTFRVASSLKQPISWNSTKGFPLYAVANAKAFVYIAERSLQVCLKLFSNIIIKKFRCNTLSVGLTLDSA